MNAIWRQQRLRLTPRPRGLHLITDEVVAAVDLGGVAIGSLHLFLQHTSAGLSLNENASPAVRRDLQRWFQEAVPDGGAERYEHHFEGPDDMPAHIKATLTGCSLLLPVRDGRLALGTWQGIYLCEFRLHAGPRTVLATLTGTAAP